jgi:hypothetical protein
MQIKYHHTLSFFLIFLGITACFLGSTTIAHAGYNLEKTSFYAYKDRYTATDYQPEGTRFYAFTTQQEDSVPIYRIHNKATGDHFYTADEKEKDSLIKQANYIYDGIAFYAYTKTLSNSQPVYQFYNKINGDHFYTADEKEKSNVQKNLKSVYSYEKIAFYAYTTKKSNTSDIYRFYNKTNGDHLYTADELEAAKLNDLSKKNSNPVYKFYDRITGDHLYTASEKEKNTIIATPKTTYKYEGIAFYAYSVQASDLIPIYRFYNKKTRDHFYTSDEEKKDELKKSNTNVYEGIAFYAYPSQMENALPVYYFYNGTDQIYTISEIEKNNLLSSGMGPNIAVGLWYYDKSGIKNDPFEIEANKPYNIKDKDGNVLAQIGGNTHTKVTYDSDNYLKIYGSVSAKKVKTAVTFDATDGDNNSLILNIHRPNSSYDEYRGKITVRYYKGKNIIAGTKDTVTQIWVINTLPLEQYTWGMGETTGTGDMDHTKVMTTIFRTYGRWYIEYATKYAPLGFKIRSDSGSQIYRGYEWEQAYPNIKKAAEATRGVVATYKSEIALTPYSSWSDGHTRSYKERWGSSDYPWCKSVDDPYGKHPKKSTKTLESEGNHMVGLIANGSLVLARDKDWKYDKIMKYYYTGINLDPLY